MAIQRDPYTFVNGTVADADEVNARFALLYQLQAGGIDETNLALTLNLSAKALTLPAALTVNLSSGQRRISFPDVRADTDIALGSTIAPPIGSIIPFYDFNGALTFDTRYWTYCDGSTATIAGIGSQTLPDLSNRYLVGFGTEGRRDIGTTAFVTAPVGEPNHAINLQHAHTVHSHRHRVEPHDHGVGTLQFETGQIIIFNGTHQLWMYNASGGLDQAIFNVHPNNVGNADSMARIFNIGTKTFYTANGTGTTGSASPMTDDQRPGTDLQLSSTQSIQPRSIRVRFIMRIA